jgi:NADH:ubiquinone oxidoreductase subunit C
MNVNVLETISQKLGVTAPWVEQGGAHWLQSDQLKVRELAQVMNAAQARFITITAYQLPDNGGFRLEYHWDIDGMLLGFPFQLAGDSIDSIFDLCEAVDWIEREIHEGYTINFTGRDYEPLQLRPGSKLGVNLHEEVAK